jgi:hypothetical protein
LSHWNHRIIEQNEDGKIIKAIYEVHYNDDGRPVDSVGPVIVDGESRDELAAMLASMHAALSLPTLRECDFMRSEVPQVGAASLLHAMTAVQV